MDQRRSVPNEGEEKVEKIAGEFRCPITHVIMLYPVTLITGITCEREAAKKWIEANGTCPTTRRLLNWDETISENKTVKGLIINFLKEHPKYWNEVYDSELLKNQLISAIKEGDKTNFDIYLERDRRLISSELQKNKTVLHLVCENGTPEMLKSLISTLGVETVKEKIKTSFGETNPFYLAWYSSRWDLVKVLTETLKLTQQDINEWSKSREFLLENKINPNEKDNEGRNAFLVRVDEYSSPQSRKIKKSLENCQDKDPEVRLGGMKTFLENLLNPLKESVPEKVLSSLLNHNKDFLLSKDKHGNNALMLAVFHQQLDMVEWLRKKDEKGDLLKEKNIAGNTALILSVLFSSFEISKYLVEKMPALIWERNKEGDTPLIIAAKQGNLALMELFLKAGANSKIKDKNQNSLRKILKKYGHENLIEPLDTTLDLIEQERFVKTNVLEARNKILEVRNNMLEESNNKLTQRVNDLEESVRGLTQSYREQQLTLSDQSLLLQQDVREVHEQFPENSEKLSSMEYYGPPVFQNISSLSNTLIASPATATTSMTTTTSTTNATPSSEKRLT